MTQKEAVLEFLQAGHSITPLKAQSEFGVWRLADVIYRLKGDGYRIHTRMKKTFSGKRFAEYSLAPTHLNPMEN